MLSFDAHKIGETQNQMTIAWHSPGEVAPASGELMRLVLENHHCNFELWHEEDKARREDKGFEYVYRAKRAIDGWNQQRNDFVERIDKHLVENLVDR